MILPGRDVYKRQVYATAGLTMQKDKALSQVEACGFQEYEEQAKACLLYTSRCV